MYTHFETYCPHCEHPLKVRLEYVGKKVACKHCEKTFRIPPPPGDPGLASGEEHESLTAVPHDSAKISSSRRGIEEERLTS